MMTTINIEKIKNIVDKALQGKCISSNFCTFPNGGATCSEIKEEERKLSRGLTDQHKKFLSSWNGVRIDIINFYGCGNTEESIDRISEWQLEKYGSDSKILSIEKPFDFIVIGDTPSGQMIIEDDQEAIYIFAFDGLPMELVANSLEEFICDYVFGRRAAEFAGDAWLQELKDAGLA